MSYWNIEMIGNSIRTIVGVLMFALLLQSGFAQDVALRLLNDVEPARDEIDIISGGFSVELKNVSDHSILVPRGYSEKLPDVLSVTVRDPQTNEEFRIRETARAPFREPQFVTLNPNETIEYFLALDDAIRPKELDQAFPETNTGKKYLVQAVYDTRSLDGNYWIGRVASAQITRRFVAKGIVQPTGYIRERLFRDAQRLILNQPELVNGDSGGVYGGFPPLHAAASVGSPEMVDWLVNHGANVNLVAHATPIAYASDMQSIAVLLEKGADPTTPGQSRSSAMSIAVSKITASDIALDVKKKWTEIYLLYRERGFELDLISAIRLDDKPRIEELLQNFDEELSKYSDTQLALRSACRFGRTQLVKRLLRSESKYIDLDHRSARVQFPVIAEALVYPKIFDILRLHGANLNCKVHSFGRQFDHRIPRLRFQATLLQYAAIQGHPMIVNLLLNRKVGLEKNWLKGESPLELAVEYGRWDNAVVVLLHKSFWELDPGVQCRQLGRIGRSLTAKYWSAFREWSGQ